MCFLERGLGTNFILLTPSRFGGPGPTPGQSWQANWPSQIKLTISPRFNLVGFWAPKNSFRQGRLSNSRAFFFGPRFSQGKHIGFLSTFLGHLGFPPVPYHYNPQGFNFPAIPFFRAQPFGSAHHCWGHWHKHFFWHPAGFLNKQINPRVNTHRGSHTKGWQHTNFRILGNFHMPGTNCRFQALLRTKFATISPGGATHLSVPQPSPLFHAATTGGSTPKGPCGQLVYRHFSFSTRGYTQRGSQMFT